MKDQNAILTPKQMNHVDLICGISEDALIENAGRAVAEEVVRRYGARRTVVLCGPGKNGRDGKVAARYLAAWGWPVEISDDVESAELIIDGLYGSGLNRDFPQALADRINNVGVPIVAIDVPSGLDGLSGRVRGASVKAALTITFFRKKPAHVLMPGRLLCGETVVLDIGINPSVLENGDVLLWENSAPKLPGFSSEGHKFNRGHATVISGQQLQTGASRLAARAAVNIGAGLVTLAGSAAALAVHASHLSAVMLAEISSAAALTELLKDPRRNALCVGPAAGVGETTRAFVRVALASSASVVIDADALTSFSELSEELFALVKSRQRCSVVMTPHEGEFARLFGGSINGTISKIERARQAAHLSGAVVVLKGADTVIAHPDGRACVNSNAPAGLATAGSGDVLAGAITGLLAQGMPVFEAACAGVWLHGDAANALARRSFTAEDLVQQIGKI